MACGCSQSGVLPMRGGGSSGGKRGVKLETEKKTDLYEKAKKYAIKGRSKMNKSELVSAIRAKQQEIGDAIARRRRGARAAA